MGKLYFMQGFARSGKSTVAKRWVDYDIDFEKGKLIERTIPGAPGYFPRKFATELPRVVVCADDIRLTLGFRYNYRLEDYVHCVKNTMAKTLLYKHDTLIDGTHTTKGSIIALLNIDIDADYYRMDTSVEVCCERAIKTNQPDLVPVIERMGRQLAALPTIDELREEVKKNQSFKTVV